LFVAGLAESAFPAGEPQSPLLGRHDHGRLTAAGLPLAPWGAHGQDEMLLFYETVTRATRRLALSYPAVDARAQPLVPSPYLDEVRRLFGEKLADQGEVDLRPAALQGAAAGPSDLRLQAMVRALDRSPTLLASLRGLGRPSAAAASPRTGRSGRAAPAPGQRALPFALAAEERDDPAAGWAPRLLANLLAGLRMLGERENRERFGRYEGLLSAPAALEALRTSFSGAYCFSPTALEQYRACPFKFFLSKVLEVESPADLELQEDYGLRGNLAHAVLADVHRRINDLAGRPTSPCALDPGQFEELFEQSLAKVLDRHANAPPLERAWREIDADLIRRWGREYLAQHEQYEAAYRSRGALRPALFELGFGPSRHQEGADDASEARPLELRRGDEVVRIAGRIDRVDVLEDGAQTLFAVVDYKSGGSKRVLNEMKHEVALQLQIYALAVEQLFFPDRAATPAQAAYWFVKETGCQAKGTLRFAPPVGDDAPPDKKGPASVDWNELREQAIDRVFARVGGVCQGQFPIVSVDDKCTGLCDYRTVCRVNHVRALEKQWQFPELPPN
jgi:RecB family exonuclease